MKEFARVSLCLGSIVLAGIVMNLLIDTTAKANNPDNPMNVIVTNTPLPVTGSFSVTNTPNVNVTNTPTVTIGNSNVPVSGKVSVSNALDSGSNPIPLAVTESGQPYQDFCYTYSGSTCNFNSIPAGMRLVIREFDSSARGHGNILEVVLSTTINGSSQYHSFSVVNAGDDDTYYNRFVTHQPTLMYTDAKSVMQCTLSLAVNASASAGECALTGYLIPMQ